jgi:hypothetical protein
MTLFRMARSNPRPRKSIVFRFKLFRVVSSIAVTLLLPVTCAFSNPGASTEWRPYNEAKVNYCV